LHHCISAGFDNILSVAAVLEDQYALLMADSAEPEDFFLLFNATSASPIFSAPRSYYSLAGTLLDQMRRLRQLLILDSSCLTGDPLELNDDT
jgi:hypothetical protein